MAAVTRTVSFRFTGELFTGQTGVLNLGYDPAEPHDVTIDFGPAGASVWIVWRDILARRVDGKAIALVSDREVMGGVHCEIDGQWASITLAARDGTVTIQLFAAQLDAFLRATEQLVPYGTEQVDVDGFLARLLDGAR